LGERGLCGFGLFTAVIVVTISLVRFTNFFFFVGAAPASHSLCLKRQCLAYLFRAVNFHYFALELRLSGALLIFDIFWLSNGVIFRLFVVLGGYEGGEEEYFSEFVYTMREHEWTLLSSVVVQDGGLISPHWGFFVCVFEGEWPLLDKNFDSFHKLSFNFTPLDFFCLRESGLSWIRILILSINCHLFSAIEGFFGLRESGLSWIRSFDSFHKLSLIFHPLGFLVFEVFYLFFS
jgi:hypothetical protein